MFKIISRGERDWTQLLLKQNWGGRVLKHWGKLVGKYSKMLGECWSMWLGHLCLLIGATEVRLHPPSDRDGRYLGISILDNYLSEQYFPGPWEGHSWVLKLARGWEKIYLFQGPLPPKHSQLQVFKVNGLGKGRSGSYQEETCLKFS